MVVNLDRIAGSIRTITTITKVVPLTSVPIRVEGAGESEKLFLRALYVTRQATAPTGSLIRFAGGIWSD